MDYSKCLEYCDEDDDCKFITWISAAKPNGDLVCRKYRSCDTLVEHDYDWTIYSKEGKCPGKFSFN